MAEVEDIEELLNKRMTASTAATLLSDIKLTARLMPLRYWLERMNVSSAGVLGFPGNSAGQLAVTEASAATISTTATNIAINQMLQGPWFTAVNNAAANYSYGKRIGQLLLTTDGAGNCAATTAVAALAGYTGHIEILGSWSPDSGATTPTLTVACTGGTLLGIASIAYTSATNTPVTLGFGSCGLFARGTVAADDNKNITIAMAGGGATKNYYINYRYFYET